MTGDKSGAVIARVQPMKLAAMEALYDGQQGAPLTAIGIARPEAERTSNEDAFYFKIDIPKLLSIMSFRDADAYVAGINDLVNGNEEYGVMSAAEKMERGRVAEGELATKSPPNSIPRRPKARSSCANISPISGTATSTPRSSSSPTYRCSSTRSV